MRPTGPRTYDEITRHTVPDPDGSFRPTRELERAAGTHFHAAQGNDRELYLRIKEALLVVRDVATSDVIIGVDRGHVTLRGRVLDLRSQRQVESIVTGIHDLLEAKRHGLEHAVERRPEHDRYLEWAGDVAAGIVPRSAS